MGEAQGQTPGIDHDSVTQWFVENIDGVIAPLRFEVITGGHSNLTYAVTDTTNSRYVLRRPPLGAILASAHDVGREYRIISPIGPTDVPVAPALGHCADDSVNGAPFYVMAYVDGYVLDTAEAVDNAFGPDPAPRVRMSREVVEVLAKLHLLNPDEIGLGELARKEGYLDRQLKRWKAQWESAKTRELPIMDEVHELLVAAKPEQRYTGIVHGDYRPGNILFRPDGSVAAVLDWELCTLGDTLADIGYLLNDWVPPEESEGDRSEIKPSAAGDFASRADLVAHYAELTGREVGNVDYYRAFQHWRLASIAEGVKARYEKGVMVDDSYDVEVYGQRVADLAGSALELMQSLD